MGAETERGVLLRAMSRRERERWELRKDRRGERRRVLGFC